MDFRAIAVFDDGSLEERDCATSTDVENFVVGVLRQGVITESKLVNITVANLWINN